MGFCNLFGKVLNEIVYLPSTLLNLQSIKLSLLKGCDFGEDRISAQPDDIILILLSHMGMKEAAKTSILSKRWRYLWAERTHLDFDHFLALPESDPKLFMCRFTAAQKDRYINWVNQVVDLHCGPCIDTFRVIFPFQGSEAAHHFDKWVKFALLRKVKNLELESPMWGHGYTLGFDILKLSVSIGDSGITSLRSLHLYLVDVSGDFIEFLLSKCHHLERLYVSHSAILVRLNVIGVSCKLKQLAIHHCLNLEELEIDDVNLTHFDYIGRNFSTKIVLKSMPMLVEAAFGGTMFRSPVSIFQQISHLAANIYKLSLDMMYDKFPGGSIPTFCNLKHLNIVVEYCPDAPVFITPLLEACPVLHELKVEISARYWKHDAWLLDIMDISNESDIEAFLAYFESDYTERKTGPNLGLSNGCDFFKAYLDYVASKYTELKTLQKLGPSNGCDLFKAYLAYLESGQTERKTHPNLKQLEVVGFGGYNSDVDVTISVMLSACNLETIIFDPKGFLTWNKDALESSRARAFKLKKIIPSKINVEVRNNMYL